MLWHVTLRVGFAVAFRKLERVQHGRLAKNMRTESKLWARHSAELRACQFHQKCVVLMCVVFGACASLGCGGNAEEGSIKPMYAEGTGGTPGLNVGAGTGNPGPGPFGGGGVLTLPSDFTKTEVGGF